MVITFLNPNKHPLSIFFLKQAAYQKALDNLDSAEGYLTDTNTKEKEQIKQLLFQFFCYL